MDQSGVLIVAAIAIIFLALFLYFIPVGLWLAALTSGVKITFSEFILMKMRKSPVKEIVNGMIMSHKAGILLKREDLEAHALAGGSVIKVVSGMIKADRAGLKLPFKEASAIDLSGVSLSDTIQKAINN